MDRPLDATVVLPGSRSITNRALLAAALADGHSVLAGVLVADDTRRMMDALQTLGVSVTVNENDCLAEVSGCRGQIPESEGNIFCGNAGTVMRFCTALVALGYGRYELDGVPRMRQRPIGELCDALRTLGAGIEYLGKDGFPPLAVHASGLHGGRVDVDSPVSSQFISALLLTAPYCARDLYLAVRGTLPSAPYVQMTTEIMSRFGVTVLQQDDAAGARFIVEAPQRYRATNLSVEPDASNASYFFAAAAVASGRVTVIGLGENSLQGDTRFVVVLEQMGCRVDRQPDRLTVFGPKDGERLRGVDVDFNDMPDMVQTLAVVALFADGPTTIRNVGNLRIKETDRLAALQRELTRLGARASVVDDALQVVPPDRLSPAEVETYDDHRMAMSFAVAGLRCEGLLINGPECCAKTFPGFFQCLEQMTGREG